MKLRYDPLQVFRLSKTPAGLYARQKWLGESETTAWKSDFRDRVGDLMANQLPEGSWHNGAVDTVKRLFGLHLTVRSPTPRIDDALEWLLGMIKPHAGTFSANVSLPVVRKPRVVDQAHIVTGSGIVPLSPE